MDSPIVIFSIGNPGPVTRHSCGHLVLKHVISHLGATQLRNSSVYSATSLNNVHLVKSNAYMNESDKAIKKFFDSNKIRPHQCTIIIIYDDFESNLGRVKISKFKKNESHNGVKSVQKYLQDRAEDCYKLGVGIGPKPSNASKDTMADWVLSSFKQLEKEVLEIKSIPLVIDYIDYIIEVEGEIDDCNKVNVYFSKNP